MAIRVLLVDDHDMVRQSLSTYLAQAPELEVVGTCATADEAVSSIAQVRPDVVLLDIEMPGLDSFEAASRIRQVHPAARILYLTALLNDRQLERAMEVGAAGYMLKTEPLDQLASAIRSVAQGATYFSPQVRERLDPASTAGGAETGVTRGARLSQREHEVLHYVAKGMTNKEIAAQMQLAVRTVDHHIERIMAKLDVHGRVNLARYAVREGLARP